MGLLTTVYNNCSSKRVVPGAFKINRGMAVFKGDPAQLADDRPLSILTLLGKIFEIVIPARLCLASSTKLMFCMIVSKATEGRDPRVTP